jgi:phenylpropionate dioxygenase-like ring-hydroxylating dioxygenase large terminal subunit
MWRRKLTETAPLDVPDPSCGSFDGGAPPLPYPNGWFGLALSRELREGAIIRRGFMGREVVLYRTRSGSAYAIQPHCPHLGANLGRGEVDGDRAIRRQ